MNGLDLWNAVEATDPKFTKDITGKAFRGTTVNNIHVAKKITAKLGPVGMAWGWNVLDERIQEFGSHEEKTYKALHWVRVAMWIKGEDGRKETFENFGTTFLASYTRSGFSVDEEAPKKSMTDALSKLMVYLGGSADVWLNQFDPHNKYAGGERQAPDRAKVAQDEGNSDGDRLARASRPGVFRADEPPLVTRAQVTAAGAEDRGEPTFLLDGVRLTGEDWIAAAVLTAKRLQPSALIVWWEKAKDERAKLHRQRPDLNETLDKLKAKVLAKAATFNGGPGHISPDDALRAG